MSTYLELLNVRGKMICVGAPPEALEVRVSNLFMGNKTIAGSLIGGTK